MVLRHNCTDTSGGRGDTISTETVAGIDAWGKHQYPPGLAQASLIFRSMDAAI